MKTTLCIILLLLLAGIGSAGLHSCTKPTEYNCDTNDTSYYYLEPDDKAQIPYTGYDTINMVSNTGDTIHCIGTGRQNFSTSEFEHFQNPACGGGNVRIYEAYKTLYIDKYKGDTIEVHNYLKIFFDNYFVRRESFNTIMIKFRKSNFYTLCFNISDKTANTYIGDKDIKSKYYKDVNSIAKDYTDSTSTVWVNKYNGILKFNLKNTIYEVY